MRVSHLDSVQNKFKMKCDRLKCEEEGRRASQLSSLVPAPYRAVLGLYVPREKPQLGTKKRKLTAIGYKSSIFTTQKQ